MSNWETFREAVRNDDVATVQRLRSQFPDPRLGFAFLQACQSKSVKVVAALLNNAGEDILVYAPDALERAAQRGDVEVLKRILPHTDPKLNDSNALLWAVAKNHHACVDVLFEVSDVDVVWAIVNERRADLSPEGVFYRRVGLSAEGIFYFDQRMMARNQHTTLTNEVAQCGNTRGSRKI